MATTGETTTTESGSDPDQRIGGYRLQIIRAAEVEFGRAGYSATPMNTIAATAGLSLATVYKSFTGKAEIWDALHRSRMDALLEAVRQADTSEPGLDRVLTGLRRVFLFLAEQPAYLEMNLREGAGWAGSTDGAHGAQRTVWSSGLEVITTGMRNAAERDELGTLSPQIAAGMAISALQVWLSEWVTTGRRDDPIDQADQMVQRLRLLLSGRPDT